MTEKTKFELRELLANTVGWQEIQPDWSAQSKPFGQSFDAYMGPILGSISDVIKRGHDKSAIFAVFRMQQFYESVFRVDIGSLPADDTPVLVVPFFKICPRLDRGEKSPNQYGDPVKEYGDALVRAWRHALWLSRNRQNFIARHVHFHLPSPSDQSFFSGIEEGIIADEIFENIQREGSWLYTSRRPGY